MDDSLRVLIVEDEALLAMELEALVEDAGHSVAGWAISSEEALTMADELGADIALVDVHLIDGPTGIEVAQYIADKELSAVVFMTANPKRIPDSFVGAIGVIAKPYTLNGVTSALRYLQEGVRRPPPVSELPVGFTLSPAYASDWCGGGRQPA